MGTFTTAISQEIIDGTTSYVAAQHVVYQPSSGLSLVKVHGIFGDNASNIPGSLTYFMEIFEPITATWRRTGLYANSVSTGMGGPVLHSLRCPALSASGTNNRNVPLSGYEVEAYQYISGTSLDTQGPPLIRLTPNMRVSCENAGLSGTARHLWSAINYL